jgi:hypothetical protein
MCGQRYTAELHRVKRKSYYHCASMRTHSNRNQNVDVAVLERQVELQFKTIQFSPGLISRIVEQLRHVHATAKQGIQAQMQVLLNQRKAIEAKRDKSEEKLLAGTLTDDAFVRLRTRFAEHLGQIQDQIAVLDSQRECDTDVVRSVLHLSRNIYEGYKTAPYALKRQYLGLFWDRFVVRDREIVEAAPTELIRALEAEKEVIFDANWLPSSPLVITLSNKAYMATLAQKLKVISDLQAAACDNAS